MVGKLAAGALGGARAASAGSRRERRAAKTREVPVNDRLATEIRAWREMWERTYGRPPEGADYLFPGRGGDTKAKHLTRQAADLALRKYVTI